jgi:hypothetical protein
MKLADLIKNIAIPLISVVTAVMVGILNHQVSKNDLELRKSHCGHGALPSMAR